MNDIQTRPIHDRSVDTIYPIGPLANGEKVQVRVSTHHSKDHKAFATSITRETVGDIFVKFDLFGDSLRLPGTPVPRYSDKALTVRHEEALAQVQALREASDEQLAKLFRPADSNTEGASE